MELKPGYKQTEIGVLPEDWDVDFIESLAFITTGSKNTQDRIEDGGYPFFVRSQTVERIDSYSFDGEAVLTAGDGVGTGKVFHYINGRFDVHQRVYRISDFKKRLNGYFFYLYFSTNFYNRIMQMTAKSSVDSVRREMIAQMSVPVPRLIEEQNAISDALSDVDALLEGLDRLIAKKRDLKQAAMQQLLTGKTRLPGFEEEWETKRLGGIANISKGTQLHYSEANLDGHFPHFNGGISPSSFTDRFNTSANTIAISEGGNSCGYVQLVPQPFWCGGHCYAVVPRSVDNLFLFHALNGQQTAIQGLRVGSGLPNVQKTALADFKFHAPTDMDEQAAIATVLSDMHAEIEALEQRRAKTADLKQAMMQELLTGKTRLVEPHVCCEVR
ncbi:MAG: restriction endonuclease subunit S [Planctomycetota bacterium]|nr:restriction endonuclease subunit S [Planctomycetota bacterium]